MRAVYDFTPARNRAAIAILAVLSAATAAAQYNVTPDGRMFDANPQVGGPRWNYTRPASPLLGGNLYASGDVRGGFALRSFSPIPSPNAFRASLGSSALSGFIRDSVSVQEARNPGGLVRSPYFDPAFHVPSGLYFQGNDPTAAAQPGLGRFPTRPATQLGFVGGMLGTAAPFETALDPRLSPQQPGLAVGSGNFQRNYGELGSSIFGVPRITPPAYVPFAVDTEPAYTPFPQTDSRRELGLFSGAQASAPPERLEWGPLDLRLPGAAVEPDRRLTSLDLMLEGDSRTLLTRRAEQLLQRLGRTADQAPAGSLGTAEPPSEPALPTLRDLGLAPGRDVFTDLRLALALAADPQAEWFQQLRTQGGDPRLALETAQEQIAAESQAFVERILTAPIQTFVGSEANVFNDEMLKAEALMEIGDYLDAANRYERARRLAPENPLAILGKGHAMLAAGDYLSAAVYLVRGLEMFPQLATFKIDLTRLLGGGEIVDIRRADIMKQLGLYEDARLRFLLGYIEVHTGNLDSGLENLEKAAESGQLGPALRRYPALLRQRQENQRPAKTPAPRVAPPASEPAGEGSVP